MIEYIMPEKNNYSRKARLEDFLSGNEINNLYSKHDKIAKQPIQKNQKEYGQRKRIKP